MTSRKGSAWGFFALLLTTFALGWVPLMNWQGVLMRFYDPVGRWGYAVGSLAFCLWWLAFVWCALRIRREWRVFNSRERRRADAAANAQLDLERVGADRP